MIEVKQNIITPVDAKKRQNLNLRVGDTVRVSTKVEEKGKTRLQVFEGIVLVRKHGSEAGATFTVRRTSAGVGVEKIFPLYSPMIDSIEVIRRAKVRQANLYHIRRKAAKEVRRQMKNERIVSETDLDQEGETEPAQIDKNSTPETDMTKDRATETDPVESTPEDREVGEQVKPEDESDEASTLAVKDDQGGKQSDEEVEGSEEKKTE